jgi:RNase H-fold protein (predicted Holliday junction resolvase)
MAVDYGEKRVGIASTDESGGFALPRAVLPNDTNLVDRILEFRRLDGADKIIIGDSKNFKGEPNTIMWGAGRLKLELEKHGVDVELHPEIYTTVEARRLQGQTHLTDASAAALILKSYIESKKNK